MAKNEKKNDFVDIEGFIEGEKRPRCIYFIYSQTKDNIEHIKFRVKDEKNKAFENYLNYYKKNIQIDQNKNIISIFEISFYLEKTLLKFYLEMHTFDRKRFASQEEYSIKKDKDLFIYNLEFKGYVDKYLFFFDNNVKPPEKKQLTFVEQFSIFNKYLNEKGLAKIEKGSTKEILVNDSIAILTKNKTNFDFDLFLCLFREIYFYSSIQRLLTIFNIKKININKKIDPKLYDKILKVVLNKPNLILKNLKGNEKLENIFYDVSAIFFKNFEQEYLETLLFPDLTKIKKDEEKTYLKKRAKMMINTILENPEKFSGLNNEIMKKLIDLTKDKKEKFKLIIFTKKLEIKLFIINETLEIIINKIEIDSNSLDYDSNDNIQIIFDYFFKILDYAQKINFKGIFVDIKEKVWENYAEEYYKNKKLKCLYLLRKNINKIKIDKKIIDKIDVYVDNLGFYYIENNKIKNRLLFDFINNDFIFEKQISRDKIDKIAKSINLNSIENDNDPFIQEYKNFPFRKIFKNDYKYFIQKLFSNIGTMDLFYRIFKLYSPEDIIDFEIINEMYFRFIALLNLDPNINNSIHFNGTVVNLIEIFYKANNNKFDVNKLLDKINSNNNLKKENKNISQKFFELQKFSDNLYKKILQIVDFNSKDKNQIKLEYQLINVNKKEIERLIYQLSKSKMEEEITDQFLKELELKIFKKIILTFSKDIILYSRISSFQKKYPNDLLEIYKIYKENCVYNLEDFLIKAENTKNVIYTFTSNLEPYLNQFENKTIETKLFGEINKKNIKQYNISDFKKEIEIEKKIREFYSKK